MNPGSSKLQLYSLVVLALFALHCFVWFSAWFGFVCVCACVGGVWQVFLSWFFFLGGREGVAGICFFIQAFLRNQDFSKGHWTTLSHQLLFFFSFSSH